MTSPRFATPLSQSSRSEVLTYTFPQPFQNLTLTGRSRAAWHTSFVIPQLNVLLDAGLVVNHLRPKHIFLTHGHSDHTLLSPAFMSGDEPPDVICPKEMKDVFETYVWGARILDKGGLVTTDESKENWIEDGEKRHLRKNHVTHALAPGDMFPLKQQKENITATVFACDHTVPSNGYLFTRTTHRLHPDLADSPPEKLKALKKEGKEITAPHDVPIFAFLGDGTAKTLASSPQWLKDGVKVVITECSFLVEEHRAQAEKTKHTLWQDLEPVIRKWPDTVFVLIHFSLRYEEEEIVQFFRDLEDCPQNIVVWADGGGDVAQAQ